MKNPINHGACIIAALLILFSFGSAMSQGISLDHTDGLNPDGSIPHGATLTFHMRITGDADPHLMLNNGFVIKSADVAWTDVTANFLDPNFPAWFDFIRVLNLWKTGSVEDTVGLGLLSLMGSGLPAGYDNVAFDITIGPVTGPDGAVLTLDSSWYPPSNPWMWDLCEENVAWDGPHHFPMEGFCVPAVITSSPVTTGEVGVPYSYDVEAMGTPAPTFSLTVAPSGMTIDPSTGLIEWTPAAGGDYDVTVLADNGCATPFPQSFVIAVPEPCIPAAITSTPVTNGEVGVLYSYDVEAIGTPAPTFALSVAPAGMTIDPSTGLIGWTPDAAGDFDVTVIASNGCSVDFSQSFVIAVPEPCLPAAITSTPGTDGVVMELYSYDVEATGFPAPTFSVVNPPPSMTINPTTGLLEWYPFNCGDYEITVVASNGCGNNAVQIFTVSVFEAPLISSDPVTEAFLGQQYSYDVESYGCPSLLTFRLLAESPGDMVINPSSGLIVWTPTSVGDFLVGVEACVTGSPFMCDSQWFSITVIEAPTAPVITSTPVTDGVVGAAYSYDVEATGNPVPTFSFATYPAGMTIDPVSGVIDWTPTVAGEVTVVVVASNGVEPDAQQRFTITVVEGCVPPAITSTPVTTAEVGVLYAYDVEATGSPAPAFALTVAPSGMTIDPNTGLINWTPDAAGDFDVTVVAGNQCGDDASQSFVITVPEPCIPAQIISTPVTYGEVGVLYTYDVEATGNPAPIFALSVAPAGMTIDPSTGLIQWTPPAPGDWDITVVATNECGLEHHQTFTIHVSEPMAAPVITSTPVTDGLVGVAYSYDVEATGNPTPTFSLTTFPAGMTIDALSGVISWTPTAVGNFDVVVVATNGVQPDAQQNFTIAVVAAPTAPVITSTPVTDGLVGMAYSYDVEATGNPIPTFSLTTFPTGMTIDAASGVIGWTPAAVGDFDVVVVAANGVEPDAEQRFTITVVEEQCPPPSIFGHVLLDSYGLAGIEVALCDSDKIVGTTATDAEGFYSFEELKKCEYWVSILVPLGFEAEERTKFVNAICGEYIVDFELTQIEICDAPRPRGYWSNQVDKAIEDRPHDYTYVEFMNFAGLLESHFYSNPINPVWPYEEPYLAGQSDSLEVIDMSRLLEMGKRGESHPFPERISRAQLMTLLLNVVSGRLHQMQEITADGRTVSQVITYCDQLINDEIEPPYDEIDGHSCDKTDYYPFVVASYILHMANVGIEIPAGLVPDDVINIAYRSGDDVSQDDNGGMPEGFVLSQNYPNPFNPSTEIMFTLPHSCHVKLEIFNIKGQKIAILADDHMSAGHHSVSWHAGELATGIYVYRLSTDEFTETRKMMLVK